MKTRKYMGITTLVWSFESPEGEKTANHQARTQAAEEILKYLPDELKARLKINTKASRCAERVSKRARVSGEYLPCDVLPRTTVETKDLPEDQEFQTFLGDDGQEYVVSMVSKRYQVFQKNDCTCQACGLKGTVMYLERDRTTKEGRAHFNLYGIEDGKEVMFTQDHIVPASRGGTNGLNNLQTYCAICNGLRGHDFVTNEQVNELREVRRKTNLENEPTGKKNHAVTAALKKIKKGVGSQPGYGKKQLGLVGKNEAKQKANEAKLRVGPTLLVLPPPDAKIDIHQGMAWATAKEKTRAKGFVIPAGTLLQTYRATSASVICVWHDGDEAVKISIPHKLLEVPDALQPPETEVLCPHDRRETEDVQ